MAGRISSYIHSDSITKNKGGTLIKVTCDTDFAAKTDEFIQFCNMVVSRAYGVGAKEWNDIINVFPHLEEQRLHLQGVLKEKIAVVDIVLLTL